MEFSGMLDDLNQRACDAYRAGDYLTSLWAFETLERLVAELGALDKPRPHAYRCRLNEARFVFNQAACLYRLGALDNASSRSIRATGLYEDVYDGGFMEDELNRLLYPPLYRQIGEEKRGGTEAACYIMSDNFSA
jgi:hypothetical protein